MKFWNFDNGSIKAEEKSKKPVSSNKKRKNNKSSAGKKINKPQHVSDR